MKCEHCGKEFKQTRREHKYCSSECRVAADHKERAVIRKENAERDKLCLYCHSPFRDNSPKHNQKYCSGECRKGAGKLYRHSRIRRGKDSGSLVEATKKARESGMSYGRYKAEQYKKTITWRDPKFDVLPQTKKPPSASK